MSNTRLSPSPVSGAFHGIQWDPLEKLKLSHHEKLLLRAAEANPLDYTLSDSNEATAYAQVLLKVLAEVCGPSGPSSKVSRIVGELPVDEALQMLYVDPVGVVTHYVITKLYEVILCLNEKSKSSGISIANTFYNEEGNLIDEWRPLLRILHLGGSGDPFAQRGAALCLSHILTAGCPSQKRANMGKAINYASAEEPLQALISWLTSQLQSSGSTSLAMVTPTLTVLMNSPEARIIFASSGGIGYLSRHIRTSKQTNKSVENSRRPSSGGINSNRRSQGASVQQLYELCFCLWTLTYECNGSTYVRTNFLRDNVVSCLVDVITSAPREKVVRVALSALRNLAICTADFEYGATPVNNSTPRGDSKKTVDGSTFLAEMISAGLIKTIDNMKERQWTDPDVVDDLNVLHKQLHKNYKDMTTWDVYKAEVESGNLAWGVLHTEKFFRENNRMLEGKDGDFSVLKLLIALAASADEDICAIACYDIGEFARYYPNGQAIAKRLGAKDIAMRLIDHDNSEVQRHALQCVSKMMIQNWASVQ